MMINCAILEDEPLAREGMTSYVRETGFLNLVSVNESAIHFLKEPPAAKIDLMFLDIQMPMISGMDFLKSMAKPPMVIITTAFSNHAVESYQLNVLDYLLKPITFDRFLKAASRAKDYYDLLYNEDLKPGSKGSTYFFVKCGSNYEKIFLHEVLFVEGLQNYVTIYTTRGKFITMLYLKTLEESYLPSSFFIRPHKSYIVAIDKIGSIHGNEIIIESHRIPISRNYREQVMSKILDGKLWDRSR